jgi:V8-like Glu-specific endopeptidase
MKSLESPFLDEEIAPRIPDREAGLESFDIEATEEEVLGTDDRTLVPETLKIPNQWICAIDVMSENPDWPGKGSRFECLSRATGTLIGSRYVLTAAHVFNDDAEKARVVVNQHTVSPARNGNNSKGPFPKAGTKSVHVAQPYWSQRTITLPDGRRTQIPVQIPGGDYALMILDTDVALRTHPSIKGRLGYWGELPQIAVVKRLDAAALQGAEIIVVGYPGDTCGKTRMSGSRSEKTRRIEYCWRSQKDEWASRQWRSVGRLTADPSADIVFHTADTYDGQSGAPIGLYIQRLLHLAAIHTAPDNAQRNKGVPVTRRMLQELCAWINADAGYQAAVIQNDTLTFKPPAAKPAAKELPFEAEFDALEVLSEEWWRGSAPQESQLASISLVDEHEEDELAVSDEAADQQLEEEPLVAPSPDDLADTGSEETLEAASGTPADDEWGDDGEHSL